MKNDCINIRSQRREQIIDAAVAVITEQGIQSLSLSEIEKKAGMSRGQLTYYFPAKEEILLAVFDRYLRAMHERVRTCREAATTDTDWSWLIRHLLELVLKVPRPDSEFHALQHTLLAQTSHREDFRRRLACLYEEWRSGLAEWLARDAGGAAPNGDVSPRVMASFFQAVLHGLGVQLAADPDAFDREEMANLCLQLLGTCPSGHPREHPANRARPYAEVCRERGPATE